MRDDPLLTVLLIILIGILVGPFFIHIVVSGIYILVLCLFFSLLYYAAKR